jgi:hypothetical protein
VHPEGLLRAVEEAGRRAAGARVAHGGSYPLDGGGAESAARDLLSFLVRAGAAPSQRARITSALAAVLHAFLPPIEPSSPHHVRVRATARGARVSLHVEDRGPRDRAGSPASAGPFERLRAVSLARARALCESLHLRRGSRGPCVTLGFDLHPVLFGEDELDFSELDYLSSEGTQRLLEVLDDDELSGRACIPPALAVTIGRLLSAFDRPQSPLEARGA